MPCNFLNTDNNVMFETPLARVWVSVDWPFSRVRDCNQQ
jgi:hypothetical protein